METMTKRECMKMLTGLRAMDNVAADVELLLEFKLTYAVAKNVRKLEYVEKDLNRAIEKSKTYKEYEKKRIELAEKHARHDKNGNPIRRARMVDNQQREFYELPNDPDKLADYESDMKALDLEWDECIKAREKQLEDYDTELDNPSDFVPHFVDEELIPEKGIGTAVMKGLIYMIAEDKKPEQKKKRGQA